MKWREMDTETRFQIVEMALSGKATPGELCKSFGMSRQTLHRAMEKAREAMREALAPKPAGRPARPESDLAIKELRKDKAGLEKELEHWKTKFEVAKTLLELERKYDRGPASSEEGKKKQRNARKRQRKEQRK
jgi:transposase-like protein